MSDDECSKFSEFIISELSPSDWQVLPSKKVVNWHFEKRQRWFGQFLRTNLALKSVNDYLNTDDMVSVTSEDLTKHIKWQRVTLKVSKKWLLSVLIAINQPDNLPDVYWCFMLIKRKYRFLTDYDPRKFSESKLNFFIQYRFTLQP